MLQSGGSGILLDGPGGQHRIIGNHAIDNGRNGIEIQHQNDCLAEGNTAFSNGSRAANPLDQAGIAVTAGSQRTAVNGNRCGNHGAQGHRNRDSRHCRYVPVADLGNILLGNNIAALNAELPRSFSDRT